MADGLPQLRLVRLTDLPRLGGWDGNDVVLTSPSLKVLAVDNCPQFTPFIISAKIKELKFSRMTEKKQRCNMMVPPGLKERSSNMKYLIITGYNLSTLKELHLYDLPELRVVWRKGPIQVVNFRNLTHLDVSFCLRLRSILSPTIASNLPQLSSLFVFECEELEYIIEKDQTLSQDYHLQPICFPNLIQILNLSCKNMISLFPISVAHGLPKLQILTVLDFTKLEQVFEQGDEANVSNDKEKVIQLPQLNTLKFEELPSLMSFIPVGYHFVFPSLRALDVTGCPNITRSFRVAVQQFGHAKTEAAQSIDENIVEESAAAQETTWPIGGNIWWGKAASWEN